MSFSVFRIIVLAFPLIWLSIVPKANADDLFESMRLELSLIGSQIEDLRLSLVSPEVRSLAPSDAGIALLRLDALEAKLRSTVGRVEALEFHLEILSKDAKHRIYEFNTKLAELENKKLFSSSSDGLADHSLEEPLSTAPAQEDIQNVNEPSNETLTFDQALLSFNAKDFSSALTSFQSFNELYPQSINVVESHYWLGKTNSELKDYKAAASAFLEAFSLSPNGLFAWKSLLGLAIALGDLGQFDQGCLTLGELKSRFPDKFHNNQDEIVIAEERLKCSL